MKKLFFISLAIAITACPGYAQPDAARKQVRSMPAQQELLKGRQQVKRSFILAGSAMVAAAIGMLIYPEAYNPFWNNNSSKTRTQAGISVALVLAGAGVFISSIPVFISGAVHKHKARILVNAGPVAVSPQIKTAAWQFRTGIDIHL